MAPNLTPQDIPDEAVEAVALVYAEAEDTGSLDTARAALLAGLPFILAESRQP